MRFKIILLLLSVYCISATSSAQTERYDFSSIFQLLKDIAANPVIISSVEKQNKQIPNEYKTMTNELWKTIAHSDPRVQSLTSNESATILKSSLNSFITEAFINAKDGTKVALLAKTSRWTHKGRDKHELPMKGKTWQGEMEKDDSSGFFQIQISGPILKDGAPIGSLVLGISVAKWETRKK